MLLYLLATAISLQLAAALPTIVVITDPGTNASEVESKLAGLIMKQYMQQSETKTKGLVTVATKTVDTNGKAKFSPKVWTTKSGAGNLGCTDAQGNKRANGEEYDTPNGRFKFKCSNGAQQIVACIGTERANNARIDVGATVTVNGFWFKCQPYPNGTVAYNQETVCISGGKEYHVGEEIVAGSLRAMCQEQGYAVLGCHFVDENNKEFSLAKGEKKVIGGQIHYCEEGNGNGSRVQYRFTTEQRHGCDKGGQHFKEGEKWSENHIRYKCANGYTQITGCYSDHNLELDINEKLVEKNTFYHCYRVGDRVHYKEYPCSLKGAPPCSVIDTPPQDNAQTSSATTTKTNPVQKVESQKNEAAPSAKSESTGNSEVELTTLSTNTEANKKAAGSQ